MSVMLPNVYDCKIAVIGLGYVGLPLAMKFATAEICCRSKKRILRKVVGFDIDEQRILDLREGKDKTNETDKDELDKAIDNRLNLTSREKYMESADVFIITVPTPIDNAKQPNLKPLKLASETVGAVMKKRAGQNTGSVRPIVIYESTVYPGATEEICIPIIEKESGLTLNEDFYCGYSPERINPGDRRHKLQNIVKVTSGSTKECSKWIDNLYGSIIDAGTHLAPNIRVAEAAKVIENTQRDLNIALTNELAIIFNKLGIDTLDVLEASGSKWNFMPFRPGLVGGHCIGVDPYYLTHKAEMIGYHPQLVLAGRRINDGMSQWVAEKLILEMAREKMIIVDSVVVILGITFKENCPDLRNSKVVDIIKILQSHGIRTHIIDPWADPIEALKEYGIEIHNDFSNMPSHKATIAAVAHDQFKMQTKEEWTQLIGNGILYDLKGIAPKEVSSLRL